MPHTGLNHTCSPGILQGSSVLKANLWFCTPAAARMLHEDTSPPVHLIAAKYSK